MSQDQNQEQPQEEPQEISIEDLELSLEVYEIQSEQKLKKLQDLFGQKKTVDPNKMFYEDRSSLEIKFQNIVSDLTEFLINQEIASTDKLRKIFFRLLQNPLIFLFKVSRFEIFNLRLNAFDIELDPIDAISELGLSILANIQKHNRVTQNLTRRTEVNGYQSYEHFLNEAQNKLIQDQIFFFYSYLRKGGNIIRKKFEDKVRVAQLYGKIEEQLLKKCIENSDGKTLKQLSTLNYQLYLLQNSFDVLCFYLKVPFKAQFSEAFKELQNLATKAKQSSNYDLFILIFLRYSKEILSKLEIEGIDPVFSSYIENVLTCLLQLWGCRLCYFQQFYQLFQKLLNLHPKRHLAIQMCLKHSPNLQKDDIVLLRTHFKHDLLQKHSELLSLLRKKTIEEINGSLSDLYHRTLYNLDFKQFTREEVINMLTVLNGNSSLHQFFGIVERALKQWNHTIDLNQTHKYIQTEYKFPKIERAKILESITLFNNLCILQEKGLNDFDQLIKVGSIQKTFLDLSLFLFSSEQGCKVVQESQLCKLFLSNTIQFLKRTSGGNTNWELICSIFTSKLAILTQKYASLVISIIIELTNNYHQYFTVQSMVSTYQQIIIAQEELKLPYQSSLQSLTTIFMRGTSTKNQEVKLFRFFDSNIYDKHVLTPSESQFVKKNCILNGQVIQAKDNGCFVLSELELITNPVQFDKVMDNYYFTLDNNAKKYVQFIVNEWHNLLVNKQDKKAQVCLSLMQNLISLYPIALPIFCTTRIYLPNNVTKRFVEVLVENINSQSFNILKMIIQFRGIRYRNGRDYVKQQIIPLVLKSSIKQINETSSSIYHFELLALSLKHSRCSDIKADLIQKVIQAINYQINQTKEPGTIYRLSNAHSDLLSKFFEKKEIDMRKKDLKKTYHELALSETKTKTSPIQLEDNQKNIKKVAIPQQIMITPYAISPQFSSEDKLQNVKSLQINESSKTIELHSLRQVLPVKPVGVNIVGQKTTQTFKVVDLSNIKYNIECHIGQLKSFCLKEGFKIVTNKTDEQEHLESNEQNITLVQYYLKEFTNPQLSSPTLLNYIQALLKNQVTYSSLFSNYSNLQKLFFGLIYLLRVAVSNNPVPKQIQSTNHVLNVPLEDRLKTGKKILQIFSSIGYHNLWAQSYNSLNSLSYYKDLKQLSGFKQESAEQTFFSWLLKVSLEKEQLKEELNILLGSIFGSRPKDQTSLMYKVSIDRPLLNLIMKSLSIKNLSFVSLLFNSNFNNLRLYTDQLHQGLKALGMASKNRAYNQYAQLSKDIQDQEFFLPMKLFKENFSFFIRIEKQGYKFKRGEEQKLGKERILKVLRSGAIGDTLNKQVQKVIQEFQEEIQKLQYNIASRVKSFYLATKLRDLSYQNSLTVCLLHQILIEKKEEKSNIFKKIGQIELFSLMSELYNELVRFGKNSYEYFLIGDRSTAQKELNVCSTRRYSHSMSKVYQRCELQFDQVFQRCIDVLRVFFASSEGKQWLGDLGIYPPFLCKSFVAFDKGQQLISTIKSQNSRYLSLVRQGQVALPCQQFSFTNLLKSLRSLSKSQLLQPNEVKIQYKNSTFTLSEFLVPFKNYLIQSETLSKSKDGYLLFNKYKTSQKTLQELQILGLIVGYSVYHNIQIDLPLHSSILNTANFGVCDLDDLIDIDFKVWQDLRTVLSTSQSKELNLNFSYIFESLQTLKPERVELIDKGTSKKVNNQNREQYADSVACYLLHRIVHKQVNRFLQALIYICPKEILSSLPLSHFLDLFLKKYPKYLNQILRRIMKRRGLILAPSVIIREKRYENTLDYQSIQWFNEIIQTQIQLRQKLWATETNLFLCTSMNQGALIDINSRTVLVGRFHSKQELKQALMKQL